MRHFPHNSRQCGKCFRETEEFLSYRVLVAVFQCDRIFGRDSLTKIPREPTKLATT
jgi:hypothetical protein